MKVAITGSTGLIGMALSNRLEAAGHVVFRVVRGNIGSNEPTIRWNPTTGEIDASGLEGVDAMVHLAGAGIGDKRWNDNHKKLVKQSRVDGTRLIATTVAALDRKPRVLVSASAIGYYGDRGDEVLDESCPPGDGYLSEVCEAWEEETRPASDAGIRTATIRTGIVLDKSGGALAKMLPLFRSGAGGRLGSGRQWMSWITIDDEVAAIEWLLDSELSGPVNLVAPNPVTNADFTRALGQVLRRPTLVPVPSFGPRLLLGREMADELLFSSQRVQPAALEESGFSFEHQTIEVGLRHVLGL